MQWIEITIHTNTNGADAMADVFFSLGIAGVSIEDAADIALYQRESNDWDYIDESIFANRGGDVRVKAYIQDEPHAPAILEAVRQKAAAVASTPGFDAGPGTVETQSLQEEDWSENWKQYYKPLPIGKKLVVVPAWEEQPADGRVALRLDPGLIFGTGSHATTRMCLAALEQYAGPGKTALDLGCGSGILGIGALLLGCAHVTGCDIDPKAPEVAAGNAALNGFAGDRFTVCAGDILADAGLRRDLGTGYDLVLANIVSDVIIPLAAHAPAFLAPGGTFICSGIIDGREDEVRAAIERAGFTVTAHDSLEEWHCFTATLA